MTFLYFIFSTLIVIWLMGLIGRATINRWLKKRTDEYARATKEAEREAKRQARSKRAGEVTIEASEAALNKRVSKSVGDYVEFEEIAKTCEDREGK